MLQSMGSQRPIHNSATELNFPPLSSSSTAHTQEVNKCNWRGCGSRVLAGGLGGEGSGLRDEKAWILLCGPRHSPAPCWTQSPQLRMRGVCRTAGFQESRLEIEVYHSPVAAESLSEEGKQLGSPVSPSSLWGAPTQSCLVGMCDLRSTARGQHCCPLKQKLCLNPWATRGMLPPLFSIS